MGVESAASHDKLKEALNKGPSYSVPFAVADGQDSTPLVRVLKFGYLGGIWPVSKLLLEPAVAPMRLVTL